MNLEELFVEKYKELDYINQTLYEENMKLNKELTKYKRAFEILKDKLKIGVCLQDDYPDGWTLYGGGTKILSQEEYELLEELMKDENC